MAKSIIALMLLAVLILPLLGGVRRLRGLPPPSADEDGRDDRRD